jgi:hypothetical protein
MSNTVSIMPDESQWRARKVLYYSGRWEAVQAILPEFELVPFKAGEGEPSNPFLQTVMRKPLSATERPIPVGVVSHSYMLASHREVASLCREGILSTGVAPENLHYEVGLSELGEWMNFRVYLRGMARFIDRYGEELDLRLECFNSVDGSSRLVVVFGWLRFVCSNGLIIGETKIEIKERHGQRLELAPLPDRIRNAFGVAYTDRARMEAWQNHRVTGAAISEWADNALTDAWGKKAAMRVYHICQSGWDVEQDDPFAGGGATEKPIRYTQRVPGSPEHATCLYDVSQALSYVATQRNNAEERVSRQTDIPKLLDALRSSSPNMGKRPKKRGLEPLRQSNFLLPESMPAATSPNAQRKTTT